MTDDLEAAIAATLRHDLWPDGHFNDFSDSMKADVLRRCDELASRVCDTLAARGVV